VFVSREGRDFLDKCLKKNPSDRVNIKELLNHEFFLKNAEKADKKMTF
jgi:serine/threonine protein kinase